jgi:hypothetical protein
MISSMAGTQKDQSDPQYTQIKYLKEMIELPESILPPRWEISQAYMSAPALGLQRLLFCLRFPIRLSATPTIVLLLRVALQSEIVRTSCRYYIPYSLTELPCLRPLSLSSGSWNLFTIL